MSSGSHPPNYRPPTGTVVPIGWIDCLQLDRRSGHAVAIRPQIPYSSINHSLSSGRTTNLPCMRALSPDSGACLRHHPKPVSQPLRRHPRRRIGSGSNPVKRHGGRGDVVCAMPGKAQIDVIRVRPWLAWRHPCLASGRRVLFWSSFDLPCLPAHALSAHPRML